MTAPVAAIDIGTNTVLLLIATPGEEGPLSLLDEASITRLGQGVGESSALLPDAIDRTLACLGRYASKARKLGAKRLAAVATSAMRDAKNGALFLDRAEGVLGVRPEVVSGEREAALTFAGARLGSAAGGPLAVFDVGGGSTEVIVGGSEVTAAASIDVGAVRLTERCIHHDPPSPDELTEVRRQAVEALAAAPSLEALPLFGVAGTVTTLAAVVYRVGPDAVHGVSLSRAQVRAVIERLAAMPLAERQRVIGLEPRRADVIVAGALVVEAVLIHAGSHTLTVSDRGVRWGLAQELLAQAPAR